MMRHESTQTWPIVQRYESAARAKGPRSVRVPLVSRQAVGLVAIGCAALGWYIEATSPRSEARPRLTRGEPGVRMHSFVLSPDGKTMATMDETGRVALRDAKDEWAIGRTLAFSVHPRALAFSADGRFLACGGFSPGITLYDLESNAMARSLAVPVNRVKAIGFAPDGRTIAVAAEDSSTIFLWDLTAERVRRTLHPPGRVLSIAWTPDGRHLASGTRDDGGLIMLWDLDTGLGRVLCNEAHGPIVVMAVSPDGTLLAAAFGWERFVRIWAVGSAERPRVLEGHRSGTNSVAFSADGLTLATAGNDGMVRLWSVTDGREQAVLEGGSLAMGPVAFALGGDCLVAAARFDNDIRVWDLVPNGSGAIPVQPPKPTSTSRAPAIQGDSQTRGRSILTQESTPRECILGGSTR
jgi:WD40 repeat protein